MSLKSCASNLVMLFLSFFWEQRKLIEIVNRVTRRNKNNKSNLPLTISAHDGLVDQNTYFNKQVASKDLSNYYLLTKGDFAYNKSYSKGFPLGTIKRLDKYENGVLSSLYIVFRPHNVNSNFLSSYYETTKWHRQILRISAEGARNHGLLNISVNDFLETKLLLPSTKDEQISISNFLATLQNVITLHQRKVKSLELLTKKFLIKIFNKKGPTLRFRFYNDSWTLVPLDSVISKEFKGKAMKKMLGSKSKYLDTSYLNGGEKYQVDSEADADDSDVLILWDGSLAGTVFKGEYGALGSTLKALRSIDSRDFLFYNLLAKQELIYKRYRTPNIPHVINTFTKEFLVSSTDLEEKESIAELLNNLVHLKSIYEKKVFQLTRIKEEYLRKLFI